MAHADQAAWCLAIKGRFPDAFAGKRVLDVGSLDINGGNRGLFTDCRYTGIDLGAGKGVDVVTSCHAHKAPDEWYETIISTETLEHDMHWRQTLRSIVRMLAPKGLFLFTCASSARGEHGTRRSTPDDAPLLQGEWADYYHNLTPDDIRSAVPLDVVFSEHELVVARDGCDLYGYGIKR